MRLAQVTGQCPHCDVRKHQIDSDQDRAMKIVSDAIERHVAETHPEATDD